MAAKPSKFAPGMSSSSKVKSTVNAGSLLNNNMETGYNLKFISFEDIRTNILNKRFSQEDIEQTLYSIRINGLLHNLVVIKNSDNKTYRLISGERRYHALEMMSKEERNALFPLGIPCKVEKMKEGSDEIDEEIKINAANIDARRYSPEETTKNIRRMIELYQIKQERGEVSSAVTEIMKLYKLTERMVRKYVAANRMIPELQEELDKGVINITDAEKFAAFSEEGQMQILELIRSNGKADKTELQALKKFEEERKQLETEVLNSGKELAEKIQMINSLKKQVASLKEEIEKNTQQSNIAKATSENNTEEIESLRTQLKLIESLLEKEKKDKARAQNNLDKIKAEAEEKKSRSIVASKEDLKKAADFAKAENIQELMFKQMKELEKVKDTIKHDETLKIQFAVIAEGLNMIFKNN